MTSENDHIGSFSYLRSGLVALNYVVLLLLVVCAWYSAVVRGEGDPAYKWFFIITAPVFLYFYPQTVHRFWWRAFRRSLALGGHFSLIERGTITFCGSAELVDLASVETIALRNRRPKGRIYRLSEMVLTVTGRTDPIIVVSLFYLRGSRPDYVRRLTSIIGIPAQGVAS